MEASDAELVRRAQADDHEAFGLLMSRYREDLMGAAYLMTRDRDLVGDVVQETLVQAWRGLAKLRSEESLKAWLMRILLNQVRQRTRRKRLPSTSLNALEGELVDLVDIQEEVLLEEERATLRMAMERLSPEHREVLLLRFHLELSLAEISGTLGLPEGTVKSRLHRAIGSLRRVVTAGVRSEIAGEMAP